MVVGLATGLTFSLATSINPPIVRATKILFLEGPPSHIEIASISLQLIKGWKEDLLFAVVGFLLACGVIWMLEEVRAYKQYVHES